MKSRRMIALGILIVVLIVATIGLTWGFQKEHYLAMYLEYQFPWMDVAAISRVCTVEDCSETSLALLLWVVEPDVSKDEWDAGTMAMLNALNSLDNETTDELAGLMTLKNDPETGKSYGELELDCPLQHYDETQMAYARCFIFPVGADMSHRVKWPGRFR